MGVTLVGGIARSGFAHRSCETPDDSRRIRPVRAMHPTAAMRPRSPTLAHAAVVLAGLVLAAGSGACRAEANDDEDVGADEAEVVSEEAKSVFGELSFLDEVVNSEPASAARAASAIAELDAASPSPARVATWAHAHAHLDRVVDLQLRGGRRAMIATRSFSAPGVGGGPGSFASLSRVVGPDGRALIYGERVRVTPRVTAELFTVEGERMKPVLRKHGPPSAEGGALATQTLPALVDSLAPQSWASRETRAGLCGACTMTLMAAKFLGPAVLGFAGTGGATATCAKVGLAAATATAPTGPVAAAAGGGSWLACNIAFYALGALITSANLIEGDEARRTTCSDALDKVWLGRVCDGIEPEVCTLGRIAREPTAKRKCVLMGQCARAFNCAHDAGALCPSLVTSGVTRETCDRIIARTCQRPLGLFEEADFEASCEMLASEPAGPAAPAPQP